MQGKKSMERIISEQDRIRRAEEIVGRRRGTISARDINVERNKKKDAYAYESIYTNCGEYVYIWIGILYVAEQLSFYG